MSACSSAPGASAAAGSEGPGSATARSDSCLTLEDAIDSIISAAADLDAAARARLAGILLEASGINPHRQLGSARLWSKREDKEGKEGQLMISPGKIPRRRITNTVRAEMQGLPASRVAEHIPPQSHRSLGRSAWQQEETLFLIFRFLKAPQLCCASSVCSVWRAAGSDERLWMWLYLGSELAKPNVMPGSWRKDFIQKQALVGNWLRGRHSSSICSGHKEAITCLSVCGSVVVSGSDDMELRVWDLRADAREGSSGARCVLRNVHRGHTGKVLCCSIVRGLLVSGSEDKTLMVWDLVSGNHVATLSDHTHAVLCLATDEKKTVFSGGADNKVCMWCLERMELVAVMNRHTLAVLCLDYSHAIDAVITGGRDHDVGIWRARSGRSGGRRSDGCCSEEPAAGTRAGASGRRSRADSKRGKVDWLVGHEGSVTCIVTESHMIATGSDDKSVRLWNAMSGACLRVLEPHGGPVSCVSIRGNLLLSGSFDGKVRLFDMLSGRCIRAMSGHENAVLCLTATQRVCISGANDRDVRIWDFHDDSPPPISASVANFKKDWGMPAPRTQPPEKSASLRRNSRRATAPAAPCTLAQMGSFSVFEGHAASSSRAGALTEYRESIHGHRWNLQGSMSSDHEDEYVSLIRSVRDATAGEPSGSDAPANAGGRSGGGDARAGVSARAMEMESDCSEEGHESSRTPVASSEEDGDDLLASALVLAGVTAGMRGCTRKSRACHCRLVGG